MEHVFMAVINPPSPPNTVSNKDTMGGLGQLYAADAKGKMPPIDIPYTAAVLRREGIPCDVIDCLGSGYDIGDLILRLSESKPEYTAIRTSTPSFVWDMRIARLIKMSVPTKVIMFGPHVTLFPFETLREQHIDAVVVGEPEMVLPALAKLRHFDRCEGIFYKQQGNMIKNTIPQQISALDDLPFPAWDLMPYREYDGTDLMRNIRPFVTVLSSRGCPHGCFYCPYPVTQGRKLRARSPKSVVDELSWLTAGLGVKAVLFRDPEFAFSRDRVIRICEGIVKQGIKLAWRCETRIENLDDELIGFMARAGCIGINMAIESADEKILASLNRRAVTLKIARSVVDACRKSRIELFCFFILGLPGETVKTALATMRFAKKLNPSFLQFTVCTPYPGTELRRLAERNGLINGLSMSQLTGSVPIMKTEHLAIEDLQNLLVYANTMRDFTFSKILRRITLHARGMAYEIKRTIKFAYKSYRYFIKSREL